MSAQNSINMGSQTSYSSCDLYVYDDGGAGGNYAANTNQTLTIYSNDPNNGCVMIEIQALDVDESDTLYIYDGNNVNGTLLHWFNNSNYDSLGTFRYAATIQNTTGALTLQFKSDAATTGAGFTIHATCMAPCQRVTVMLDTVNSSHVPVRDTDGYYYIDLCPGEPVHIVTYCDYPDNDFSYHQSDALTTFEWDLDVAIIDTVGGNILDHTFTSGRGYSVAVSAVDQSQCPSLTPVTFRVRTSMNPFLGVSPLPDMCSTDEIDLSVGYDSLSIVQLTPISSQQTASLRVNDTVFLPDGISCAPYGNYYRSYVNFTNFLPGSTITSANDILYVRIKMEHSAIEDIRISLVCPSGNTCKIVPDYQNDGWGGVSHSYFRTNLGLANRQQEVVSCDSSLNPMGMPWNYIWSNNTTLGYQYAPTTHSYCFEPGNIHSQYNPHWDPGSTSSYCIDSSNVTNMTQIYHPFQPFSNMVNCPLNGNWYIQVEDLWTNDNGYIVEWEMALDPSLLPQNWSYDVNVDTTYLTGPGADGLHIAPDTCGNLSYHAVLVDEFGCQYDTNFPLQVVRTPQPNLGNDFGICEGETATISTNYNAPVPSSITWSTGETDTDSITVNAQGTYIVEITSMNSDWTLNCTRSDTVNVTLNPQPVPNFTITETEACGRLEFQCINTSSPNNVEMSCSWYVMDGSNNVWLSSPLCNPTFVLDQPGDYSIQLIVVTDQGCTDSVTQTNCVHVYPQPTAAFTISPEASFFSESQGVITITNTTDMTQLGNENPQFHWVFGDDSEEDNNEPNFTHTYGDWGDYTITVNVVTDHECTSNATMDVVLEPDLKFPNIITPNDDNSNDVFAITNLNIHFDENGPNGVHSNELFIYDRWGKRVYHAHNYDTYAKDGIIYVGTQYFDAKELSDGLYYFTFHYNGALRDIDYHGSLTVIR